ncbi:MAG: hypothetical protein HY043_05660 [Verrucomicrobia bacterium]|nr:hypothetical protein [Verrucomicrobiota bacterium]
MSVQLTELVRQQVAKTFAPEAAALVIAELEAAELPLIANNGERVHLAILHLCQGDLGLFDRDLRIAKTDWRDTLVAAGLAHGNWPEVLRSRGIEISRT